MMCIRSLDQEEVFLTGYPLDFKQNKVKPGAYLGHCLDRPSSAGTVENGYEKASVDIKGRFWNVALKKRF